MKRVLVGLTICLVCLAMVGTAWAKEGEGERERSPRLFVPTLQGGTTYCSTPGLPIDSTLPPAVDTITVPDSVTVTDVDVSINAVHTFVGDLLVEVAHDNSATSLTMWDSLCGSGDDIDVNLNDEGVDGNVADCPGGTPAVFGDLVAGTTPDPTLLANFDGLDSASGWTLTITDQVGGDVGVLNEWCVIIDGDGGGCNLRIDTRSNRVRAGRTVAVRLDISHRRPATVNVPFWIWVEDAAGNVVASRSTPPVTLHQGDNKRLSAGITIPAGTPAGTYAVFSSVREMRQGEVEARKFIQVR